MRAVTGTALAAALLAVSLGGCVQPRLASRPLTGEQMEWMSFIRASYPGWRAPYYSPAVTSEPMAAPVSSSAAALASPAGDSVPAAPVRDVEFVPAEPSR